MYSDGMHTWQDEDLWAAASTCPVRPRRVSELILDEKIHSTGVSSGVLADLLLDIRRALACDLSYPIILTPDGWLCEGAHRIMKAIITGVQELPVVQLDRMPDPIPEDEPHE